MNRLLKPLALAVALLMLFALLPAPVVHAEDTLNFGILPAGDIPTDNQNHSLTIEFYLTMNGQVLTSLPAEMKTFTLDATIPHQSNLFSGINGTTQYTKDNFPAGGKFTFVYNTKGDAFNGVYESLGNSEQYMFTLTYDNGTASGTQGLNTAFKIAYGQDTINNPNNPNDNPSGGDSSKDDMQTIYDITLIPTPIARDDENGNLTLQLHLAYQGDKNFQKAPLSYFRLEPVFSGEGTTFPFKMEYTSYAKTMSDLVVVKDSHGDVVDTYFEFPLKVKDDAVNGFYPITFKILHLYQYTNLQETKPAETTITTYVEIRHGKKAADSEKPETPTTDPSTAILLLEGYTINLDEVSAGDEFDLTLKIRNTSSHAVTDVKSTLEEANKTIVPVDGTNSFFIEKIGAGKTVEQTIRVKATATAGVEPVSLTLKNEFVQDNTAKTSTDTFTIPVRQVSNLSLDPPNYPVDCYQGDSFNLMMKMYNKGNNTLKNVMVTLESDMLKADENYYAGNMESGSTREYDVMVTPTAEASGQVDGEIVVSYQDEDGNVTEKRTPITINVAAMDMGYMEPMPPVEEMPVDGAGQPGFPVWAWIVIGVVVVGAVVAVLVIVRKRKKAQVDDDEMD